MEQRKLEQIIRDAYQAGVTTGQEDAYGEQGSESEDAVVARLLPLRVVV